MTKSKVYTRSGDKGSTGLVGGTRVPKGDARIHIYGEVDELNSHLGMGISLIEEFDQSELVAIIPFLKRIQYNLFVIGSIFACEKEKRESYSLPTISEEDIVKLESEIDRMDSLIEPLKYFVLPGGHKISSQFHIIRTVCRRAERYATSYESSHNGELPVETLKYLNRLSDFFFIISRFANKVMKCEEVWWIPGKPTS
ncbi:putative vitamin B12 related cobalamin adenosyltransferase [Halobacteriovorax marinus SJ]|uniref:Corrinoid adenosyltransferase n=1 Tax=Halobacteriovorax marinus (strain ATCC BAA-682 / DSM 15412 / SJ) TaxID=862908 RepID=E1X151_HALMS|nr:cob(I)yrinic acid a,c-diamide adenosyltransferase [Halobacteriovorax marinus]CBW28121.1 putative vitamin B12 related cobalamin adenosyltransferase [Halobacteriovorax marinus SJ]